MVLLKLMGCSWRNQWVRSFKTQQILRDLKSDQVSKVAQPNPTSAPGNPLDMLNYNVYKPTEFDKKILVWVKRYKNKDEIPDRISVEIIHQARSKARIRTANWMTVATIIGCFIAIFSGKARAGRGESISQMNLDWHSKLNKEFTKAQGQGEEKKE